MNWIDVYKVGLVDGGDKIRKVSWGDVRKFISVVSLIFFNILKA